MGKIRLFVIDCNQPFLENVKSKLEVRGFEVDTVASGDAVLDVLLNASATDPFELVILGDLPMPREMQRARQDVLQSIKSIKCCPEVIVLTNQGTTDDAVESIKNGAYHYLQKPCELDKLLLVLADAYVKKVADKLKLDPNDIRQRLAAAKAETQMAALRWGKQL